LVKTHEVRCVGVDREELAKAPARRQRLTLNESVKEKVERLDLFCLATKPADKFAE
jgi:hypothetical protein